MLKRNTNVELGQCLSEAIKLAETIASYPQVCMRGDRQSAYESYEQTEPLGSPAQRIRNWFLSVSLCLLCLYLSNILSLPPSLLSFAITGKNALKQGESLEGAIRFSSGVGKHGKFDAKLWLDLPLWLLLDISKVIVTVLRRRHHCCGCRIRSKTL